MAHTPIDTAVRNVTQDIAQATSPQDKLKVLLSAWGFLLPMASPILTVLYPNDFTVYDVRVCDVLGDFHWVANRTKYEDTWTGYMHYLAAVQTKTPLDLQGSSHMSYFVTHPASVSVHLTYQHTPV
jgi:hypothetical protein